jgi:nitrate/TMAO reductase-like tetraheme cytochrome c subunit
MKARFVFVLSLFFIALLLVVPWITFILASSTSICGTCHATSKQYKSWQNSKHASTNCMSCHLRPGFGGRFLLFFEIFSNLAKTLNNHNVAEVVFVDEDNCLACHDRIIDDVITKDNLRVSHSEIINAGWRCVDCHANVGHQSFTVGARLSTPSMDKCITTCHKSKHNAATNCRICHLRKPRVKPTNITTMGTLAHNKNWDKNHGMNALSTCRVCHNKHFCRDCHFVNIPHESNWPDKHGKKAITYSGSCNQCHKAKFCNNTCHANVSLPHSLPYRHTKEANRKPGPGRCIVCHQRQNCVDCHAIHAQHLKATKDSR